MKRLRYILRLVSAFTKRFSFTVVLVSAGSFLIALLVIPFINSKVGTNIEKIGLVGRYSQDNLPLSVTSLISRGLVKVSDDGLLKSDLAKDWEPSIDGKEWTFHIEKNNKWQDGTVIDSGSINYSYDGVAVEKVDDYTLKFKLSSPFSPFPTLLSRPVFKRGLLGNGDWRVVSLSVNGEVVSEIKIQNGEKIKYFIFYPSEDRAKLAFQLGQINNIDGLTDVTSFDNWKTVDVSSRKMDRRFAAVFFNSGENSLFYNNKELRQGLSYAIDKSAISSNRAISPIFPSSWAYNSQVKPYDYDKKRATELVSSFVKKSKDSKPKINLFTTSALLSIGEKIANDWRSMGIDVDLKVTSVKPSNYDAFLAFYDASSDPDQYTLWHSTQKETNISNFSNPRIDKLLEDGRLETDQEKRKKIYLDFQRYLLEEAPAVFLFHPMTYTVVRK